MVEVQTENPLLVICAYLPSRKYVKKDSSTGDPIEFMSTLDQLQEIIHAYENTHNILLCGDMNSSLLKRHGNPQDQKLSDFVSQLGLSSHQDGTSTFFHGNGRDDSETDYILTKCEQNLILKPTTVAENSSSKLSDHTTLSMDIKMDFESQNPQKIKISVRPKWSSFDVQLYKEAVRKWIITSFHNDQTTDSIFDIHCQIRMLTDILKAATEYSIPNYKPEIYKKQIKNLHRWSPDVYSAIRKSRRKWGEWKKAGKPDRSADPVHFDEMKKAKTKLRKAVRQNEAKSREAKMRKIMDSENSTKFFHTLVRMQKKIGQLSNKITCSGWDKV